MMAKKIDGKAGAAKAPVKVEAKGQAEAKAKPAKEEAAAGTTAAKPAGASPPAGERDWSQTLFLPKTDFPMKAGLPELEPRLLKRWDEIGLYQRLREAARGKPKFLLHD